MSSQSLRVLLLIPSYVKYGIEPDVAAGRHPRMDYHELARVLAARGCSVEIADYAALPLQRGGLKDVRLALHGYAGRRWFDVIFCNSESIALPLGVLLRRARSRPRIVGIGHRISTPKKQAFFTKWHAMDAIDTLFLYAAAQQQHAVDILGVPKQKCPLIAFHADQRFFRPADADPDIEQRPRPLVCAAGLEWRDYPTLLQAAARMPETDFHIAAASPWSKHRDETADRGLPPNVTVKRHPYESLRTLYQAGDLTVVPLYETDFQAGVTTILEAMACAKAVVTSSTKGQTDVIQDGINGFYVSPGDADMLEGKLAALLADKAARTRIGAQGREWVEQNASLDLWAATVADAICR